MKEKVGKTCAVADAELKESKTLQGIVSCSRVPEERDCKNCPYCFGRNCMRTLLFDCMDYITVQIRKERAEQASKPKKKYIVHAKSAPCDEEPEIGKDFTKEFDDFWTANAYMEELDNETYLNGCHVYCQTYIEEKAVEQ